MINPRHYRGFISCLYGLGVFLLVQNWIHVSPFLPVLILLACPLMHVFMHRSHGGHKPISGHGQTPP
jgi:hypothetical protein